MKHAGIGPPRPKYRVNAAPLNEVWWRARCPFTPNALGGRGRGCEDVGTPLTTTAGASAGFLFGGDASKEIREHQKQLEKPEVGRLERTPVREL